MATGQINGVIRHLRKALMPRAANERTDGQLLDEFLGRRDENAFEMLVHRHGPMVLGVCRRILGNAHDAEDAFQAVFLVLVRRAAAVRPRDLVGNWLYGVAYRTALKSRTMAARRHARQRQVSDMPAKPACEDATRDTTWRDLQPLVDEELHRLSDKLRVPVVLCDLEGKSRREAARQLGWPEGTLSTRLTRGRQLLAQRLTRRGVTLSAGALALTLAQQASAAGLPAPLVASTVQTATLVAAGQAGLVSAKVAALTQGVLQAMFLTKLKSALALLLAVAVLGAGGWIGLRGLDNAAAATPAASYEIPNPAAEDEFTALGERGEGGGRGERERAAPSLQGKVVAVAKDGKMITVEAAAPPRRERGAGIEEAKKVDIKLTDKTMIRFSGVGMGGAKLTEGYMAQIWLADGSKDVAAIVHLTGNAGARAQPDLSGRV